MNDNKLKAVAEICTTFFLCFLVLCISTCSVLTVKYKNQHSAAAAGNLVEKSNGQN